ncbi:MAG: hypothetical protein LBM98_00440 [Oscillospiraceae bacterium]|nr:hypothetical protein [Oscillospiraceae bacterium]
MNNYAGRIRGCLRQPWIASPHTDLRNSTMGAIRRPRRTGFANMGRAKPCPVPAHCAGTVDVGCVRARRGEDGFETRPYVAPQPPSKLPSLIFDI